MMTGPASVGWIQERLLPQTGAGSWDTRLGQRLQGKGSALPLSVPPCSHPLGYFGSLEKSCSTAPTCSPLSYGDQGTEEWAVWGRSSRGGPQGGVSVVRERTQGDVDLGGPGGMEVRLPTQPGRAHLGGRGCLLGRGAHRQIADPILRLNRVRGCRGPARSCLLSVHVAQRQNPDTGM